MYSFMAHSKNKGWIWASVIIAVILVAVFFLYNASAFDDISEIKSEENIGKSVVVRGEVGTVVKIGELSGYTLEDATGSIAVSSDNLPNEGEMKTVSGTLMRDTIFGYYIKD